MQSCLNTVYTELARRGELQTQKLKSHLLRTQCSKVLPVKSGAGPSITMHATPTVRDFFPANFYPSGPFTYIFSETSPKFFLCLLWLTPVQATYIDLNIWDLPKIPPRGQRRSETRTRRNSYRLTHCKCTYRLDFYKSLCGPGAEGFK